MHENNKSVLNNIPEEGFIKLSVDRPGNLPGTSKAALIRKGNVYYNSGEYEKAKRIFITTGYTDGLIRIGDWYLDRNEPFEALKMYWLAPAPDKVETWVERAAGALRKLLNE